GLAAGRDHRRIDDLQRRRCIAGQRVGAAVEPSAESGELDLLLLQRAIGEKPDVVAHCSRANPVKACAKASRDPASPVSLKRSAVSDWLAASSTLTPLSCRKRRAAAPASSIGPPAL